MGLFIFWLFGCSFTMVATLTGTLGDGSAGAKAFGIAVGISGWALGLWVWRGLAPAQRRIPAWLQLVAIGNVLLVIWAIVVTRLP